MFLSRRTFLAGITDGRHYRAPGPASTCRGNPLQGRRHRLEPAHDRQGRGARPGAVARFRRRPGQHRPRRHRAAQGAAARRHGAAAGLSRRIQEAWISDRVALSGHPAPQLPEERPAGPALGRRVGADRDRARRHRHPVAVLRQGGARDACRDGLRRRRPARSCAGCREGQGDPGARGHDFGEGQRAHHGACEVAGRPDLLRRGQLDPRRVRRRPARSGGWARHASARCT